MPTAEGMRHFKQGVSVVKQWTGRESKEVEKQLLPVIASLDSKVWNPDFIKLSRALLDFIYRAQASRMTEDDIVQLEKTLVEIHELKFVLRQMKIFKSDSRFNKIVKLHMLSHWPNDTRQMGTADGFSTESPEHMHIESKRAWRASNKVRPTPQMIILLQRYEALRIHRARMDAHLGRLSVEGNRRRRSRVVYGEDEDVPFQPAWEPVAEPSGVNSQSAKTGYGSVNEESIGSSFEAGDDENEGEDNDEDEDEDEGQQHYPGRMRTAADARRHVVYPNPTLSIAIKPTCGRVRGIDIMAKYGAADLIPALHAYLDEHGTRKLPPNFLPTAYHEFPVWHRLYLRHETLPFDPDWTRRDVIRARPADDKNECVFDVALILHNRDHFGIHRTSSPRVLHLNSSGSSKCSSQDIVLAESALFSPSPLISTIFIHIRSFTLRNLAPFRPRSPRIIVCIHSLIICLRAGAASPFIPRSILPPLAIWHPSSNVWTKTSISICSLTSLTLADTFGLTTTTTGLSIDSSNTGELRCKSNNLGKPL
jgi:hypothetical protein